MGREGPSPHRPLLRAVGDGVGHARHGQPAPLQLGQPVAHEEAVGAEGALAVRHGRAPHPATPLKVRGPGAGRQLDRLSAAGLPEELPAGRGPYARTYPPSCFGGKWEDNR